MMHKKYFSIPFGMILFYAMLFAQDNVTILSGNANVDAVVTVLYTGPESVWIGTETKGVFIRNKITGKISVLKNNTPLTNKKIQCFADDGEHIWIGTENGLYRHNRFDAATEKAAGSKKFEKSSDIRALLHHDERLYIGTAQGAFLYNTHKNKWDTSIPVLDTLQQMIQSIGYNRNFLWLGTDNGVLRYDIRSAKMKRYTKTSVLPDDKITCAYKDNRHMWFGTKNGLCRYTILLDTWTTYTIADGCIDNMITALKGDGRYVWVGTLMGLSRFDVESQTWQNYDEHKTLSALAIHALEVEGDLLWIGADMKGILKMEKQIPQCLITGVYADKKLLAIVGTIADKDNQLYTLEYGPNIFPFIGFRKGIEIFEQQHAFHDTLGSWNLDNITDGDYLIRLQVIDNKGNSNEDYFPLFIDIKPPQVTIDSLPPFIARKKCPLQGSFYGHTIRSITLKPGKEKATIDFAKQRYSGTVTLLPGKNGISVTIKDAKGRKKTARKSIVFDNTAPEITCKKIPLHTNTSTVLIHGSCTDDNARELVIDPGEIHVKCIQKTTSFSQNIPLTEGTNTVSIKCSDKAGNISTVEKEIVMDTTTPSFSVIPPKKIVNKPQVTIKGTYADDHIDKIMRIPQKSAARLDTSNRNFSLTVTLHEGTNLINLTCFDRADNTASTSLNIVADFTPPHLKFMEYTNQTDKEMALLQGTYTEENLASIIADPGEIHAIINESFHAFKLSIPLKTGKNAVHVTAKDQAGNSADYSFIIIRTTEFDTSEILISKEEFHKTQETISQLMGQVAQLQTHNNQSNASPTGTAENATIASLKREIYTLKKENKKLKKKTKSSPSHKTVTETQSYTPSDSLEQVLATLAEENRQLQNERDSLETELQNRPSQTFKGLCTKYVSVTAAVLRERPDINSNDIGRVYQNKPVTVMYELNYFTRVITEDGQLGYIRNTLLSDEIRE